MKILIVFALSFFSTIAFANPCYKDQQQYCSTIEPGKGQIAKCLADYEDRLSPACKNELKEFRVKTKKKNPCFEDLVEYCGDIPADKIKIEVCLLKNENRLSAICAQDFKKAKGKILTGNVCAQDIANNCYADIKGDEGSVGRCLIKNEAKLSKFCKVKVQAQVKKMKDANPCFDDTEKLCQGLTKFVEIHPCLVKNQAKLSPLCGKRVKQEEEKIASRPCYMDLKTHCVPDLNPAQQEHCLTINKDHLSNKCTQFMQVKQTKIQSMVTNCEADRIKFCSKEPFEGGKVLTCLKKFKAQLTPACSKLL